MEENLREAACNGDIEALESILSNGIDVNSKNKMNGWTALHWAARRNNVEAVKVRNPIYCTIYYVYHVEPVLFIYLDLRCLSEIFQFSSHVT